jgi:hypothetical protein
MGARAPFFLAAMLACGGAEAAERFALAYPGWTYYLGLEPPRATASLQLRLDVPAKPLLSESGLRLPLRGSTFLSIEAALVEWRANPALPETARYEVRAGIGVGLEF